MEKTRCLECGGVGTSKNDFAFCTDCKKFAIHRYCFPDWPKTKLGKVNWSCGCADQPNLTVDEIDTGLRDRDFFDDGDSEKKKMNRNQENQEQKLIHQRIPPMKSFTGYGNVYGQDKPVEPLIRSVWTGTLLVKFMNDDFVQRSIDGFSGFLSNKASKLAKEEVVSLGPVMHLEMVPKYLVWPKMFGEQEPSGEDIALYFFPCIRHDGHRIYDYLVYEMARDDVVMRMELEKSELLIFTSMELPSKLKRFQGTFYLWGLVKEKTVDQGGFCSL